MLDCRPLCPGFEPHRYASLAIGGRRFEPAMHVRRTMSGNGARDQLGFDPGGRDE